MLTKRRVLAVSSAVAVTAIALSGCAGAGGGGQEEGDVTLTLATVSNPQMKDMEELKGAFEEDNPGIKVNFVQMEEGDLRAAVTADVASKAGQYDIVTVGAYEVPQWGALGWLKDLTPALEADEDYDVDDLLEPVREAISVDGKQYAVPFYGESSILMYNKEMFDAAGLTMPNEPTWQEVAEFARTLDSRRHRRDLPARQARLGGPVRAAHHGRADLRRHLVRHGLERPGRLTRSSPRRSTSTSTCSRMPASPTRSRTASRSA